MKRIQIEAGEKVKRLTFVRDLYVTENGRRFAEWECDCGKVVVRRVDTVVSGNTGSCGCLNRENGYKRGKASLRHGLISTAEYRAYHSLKSRCCLETNAGFKDYGARGIRVCERWLGENGFQHFLADMGKKPSADHTIERVNNNGNYEPSNCVWALPDDQARNRRSSVRLLISGKTMCQAELARLVCATPKAIEYHRLLGKTGIQIYRYFVKRRNNCVNTIG